MADWRDGPEYAPRERPDVFALPPGAPLETPPAPRAAAPDPAGRPEFSPPESSVPLAGLAPAGSPGRDPLSAFSVTSAALTPPPPGSRDAEATQPLVLSTQTSAAYVAPPGTTTGHLPEADWSPPDALPATAALLQGSAWDAAHAPRSGPRAHDAWAPGQPLALPAQPPVNPPPGSAVAPGARPNPDAFPTADADRWYAPYGQAPPGPTRGVVSTAALVDAADPLVLASLLGGGLLPFWGLAWASPLLLIAALVLASRRVQYRRRQLRGWFAGVLVTAAAISVVNATDVYPPGLGPWWDAFCGWAQLGCWVLLPALLLLVSGALRRGEHPEP